jgi:hypothetical protein
MNSVSREIARTRRIRARALTLPASKPFTTRLTGSDATIRSTWAAVVATSTR